MAYSQSFLGRAIFGPLWGITLFAAIGNTKPIKLPFDAGYKFYMAKHQKVIENLLNNISKLTNLDKLVMAIALDEAPWLMTKKNYYDSRNLDCEFALYSGERKWIEYDYSDSEEISRVSSNRIKQQLIIFFNALFEARFCFYNGKEGNLPFQCQVIFQDILYLIGKLNLYYDVENMFAKIYHEWSQKEVPLILIEGEYESDYQCWLSARMLEFDAYFSA